MIKRSIFGLLAAAFSTESRIFVTMDSLSGFVTSAFNTPCSLIQPEISSSPGTTLTGTGSPVTGEVSTRLSPSITFASSGILSPGRIIIISFTLASCDGISFTSEPTTRLTTSGRISTASIICPRLFSTAISSNNSPIR